MEKMNKLKQKNRDSDHKVRKNPGTLPVSFLFLNFQCLSQLPLLLEVISNRHKAPQDLSLAVGAPNIASASSLHAAVHAVCKR